MVTVNTFRFPLISLFQKNIQKNWRSLSVFVSFKLLRIFTVNTNRSSFVAGEGFEPPSLTLWASRADHCYYPAMLRVFVKNPWKTIRKRTICLLFLFLQSRIWTNGILLDVQSLYLLSYLCYCNNNQFPFFVGRTGLEPVINCFKHNLLYLYCKHYKFSLTRAVR